MVAIFFFSLTIKLPLLLSIRNVGREEKTLQGREAEEEWMMNKQHGGEKGGERREGEERGPCPFFGALALLSAASNLEPRDLQG